VYFPPLDGETRAWPGWVRVQVEDALHGRNGLTSHLPLDQYKADPEQITMLREVLEGDERLQRVIVPAIPRPVYAYLQENSVRCELRPLVEGLGGRVLYEPGRPLGIARGDKEIVPLPEDWQATHEGNYTRCRLRPVAEWFGKRVTYDAASRTVSLT